MAKTNKLGKGIRKRENGVYEARATVNGQSISLYGTNLQKLKKELELAKEELSNQSANRYKNITLDEWFFEYYKSYIKHSMRNSTKANIMTAYRQYIRPYLGCVKVVDLTNIMIQNVVSCLYDDNKSDVLIHSSISRLKKCLDVAVVNHIIPVNPATGIFLRPISSPKKEKVFLTRQERNELLGVLEDHWSYNLIYIMCYTGLRAGEVGGLKWCDIDFDAETISVNRSMQPIINGITDTNQSRYILSAPKTKASVRTIPFLCYVRDILIEQKKYTDQLLKTRWILYEEDKDFVFLTPKGKPISQHTIKELFKKINNKMVSHRKMIAADTGSTYIEPKKIHPHSLRHTFCSSCYENGIDVKVTQKWMGHTNISTTLNVYTHLNDSMVNDSISKFQ